MAKKASASVPELATFNAAKKKADDLAKQLKDAADALREKGSSAATAKDFKALADAIGKLKQLRQTVPSAAQALRDATDAARTALDAYIASLAAKAGKDAQTAPDALSPLPPGVFPDTIAGSGMKVVNANPGGTTGAQIVEIDGRRYVFKTAGKVSAEHVRNEAAADHAYRRAGIRVPDCRIYEEGGKTYKLSEFIDGGLSLGDYLAKATPEQRKAALDQLAQGYPLDALFGNRDAYGTSRGAWHGHDFDNILVDKDGNVWRIDNGSAFGFRAQGAKKDAKDWEKREWPDEWRTLREYNPDLFGKLDAHAIFTNFNRLDVDAALKDLPDDVKKALEKPLAEMRQLGARCSRFDDALYAASHTSGILEASYDLSKLGVRELVPKSISENDATTFGWMRPGHAGMKNGAAPSPDKAYQDILAAVKSIKHHIEQGDHAPPPHKTAAALDHKTSLISALQAGDKNAKEYLDIIAEIEKSSTTTWTQFPSSLKVKPHSIHYPASTKRSGPSCFAEAVEQVAAKEGVDISKALALFSDQGGSSASDGSCEMKVFEMEALGIDPRHPPANIFMRKGVDEAIQRLAKNPSETKEKRRALEIWKAGTQLFLENTDLPTLKRDNGTIRLMRSLGKEWGHGAPPPGVKLGEIQDFAEGAHESYSSFTAVCLDIKGSGRCKHIWIRDVPIARISGSFVSTSKTGGSLFLGDGENEFGANTIGIPCYVTKGRHLSGVGVHYFDKEVEEAEKRAGMRLCDAPLR